jgi:DNA-binding winged helix-turn-helix (wHTH) protein
MSAPHNHLYEFEDFVLDPDSRLLFKDGAIVRLTPKAFDTLLALVQQKGQVADNEQLLKEVWPDSFVEEGSLSRNIHELRKVLGDNSSEPRYIENIRKRGYRFVPSVKVSEPAQKDIIGEQSEMRQLIAEPALPEALPSISERAQSQKHKRIVALVLGPLFVVVVISAVAYWKFTREPAKPTFEARDTLVRLTNNTASDLFPSWSPDGTKIAFSSNRDGMNEIYVMDADGSNVKRLTNNLANDESPRWSPDMAATRGDLLQTTQSTRVPRGLLTAARLLLRAIVITAINSTLIFTS